jgi:hypothetical protein
MLALGIYLAIPCDPSHAQSNPQDLLIQADGLIADGDSTAAWVVLETLTRDFAGQVWDAEARMHKAFVLLMVRRDPAGGQAMLESIVRDFPASEVGLRARRELLQTWAARQPVFDSRSPQMEEFLDQLDVMIVELGGSPLDSPTIEITPITFLDEELQRYHLNILYGLANSKIRSGAISGQFSNEAPDKEMLKKAFRWAMRRSDRFPEFHEIGENWSYYGDAEEIFGFIGKDLKNTNDQTPPTISAVSPAPDASVPSRRPEIVGRVASGTVLDQPVDVEALSMTLDGQPVTFRTTSSANLDDPNASFMTFTLTHEPTTDLAAGVHRVKIRATENGLNENPAEFEWAFTIANTPPPGPTTETIPAIKDALVYERGPHANEGANPRLTLEKITGKAARNLLGFNLSDIDTNSLASATLVLTIDPTDQVTGWGNGDTVSLRPVTVDWTEGNGKKHGVPSSQQTSGSGAGTTWFSPVDSNISNDSPNSVVNWSGAAANLGQGTAPPQAVHNHQTGELYFDVTDDVLNGVPHGWLLRKDAENKGSKVSFYSREGGGANLGPRLIIEYGSTAMSEPNKMHTAVAAFFGFKSRSLTLQASAGVSEGPRGLKEFLRRSPASAFVGEQVVLGFAGHYPLAQLGARVVYRSWLRETPSLV